MDFRCPTCGISLAENIPKPVATSGAFLSLRRNRARACPACSCHLEFNHHPLERIVHGLLLLFLCLLAMANFWLGDIRLLLAGAALALLGEFAWQGCSGRRLQTWRRYLAIRPDDETKRKAP